MDPEEVNKLYRIRRTLLQMMQARGYNVPVKVLQLSPQSFQQQLNEGRTRACLNFELSKLDEEDSKLMILFSDDLSIKVSTIASIAQRMNKEAIKRTIIVGKGKITPSAKKAIDEFMSHFIIEFFEDNELLEDITEQESVPNYLVLDHQEKQALLSRYGIKQNLLPKISVSDPLARYFGVCKGQVIQLIRNSEVSDIFITYRLAA